jgi:hypothetical protein
VTPIVWPDVELEVTAYLRANLPTYYADPVRVSTRYTGTGREVVVRRDGGNQLDQIREAARLGVNVYATAKNDQAVANLARIVVALLVACPDGDPIVAARMTMGPTPIPESGDLTRRYLTVELTVRGTALQGV